MLLVHSRFTRMDGRGNSDLGSYFNHLHVIDGAASFATAGKEIFSTPFSSAAVDANSFAIPCAVTARSTSARPAAAATIAAESAKRKRGRPRKYGARSSLPSLPSSAMSAAARLFHRWRNGHPLVPLQGRMNPPHPTLQLGMLS
ncbi:hypothetical protein M5K25_003770 [Dendrobium thyrsiflorum]|uniref:Uncharacterized protein n=1 Tax=Dendrobium thyrsiflorum TaxID=117978 RepID=A0ABD0VL32_DENTH